MLLRMQGSVGKRHEPRLRQQAVTAPGPPSNCEEGFGDLAWMLRVPWAPLSTLASFGILPSGPEMDTNAPASNMRQGQRLALR